MHAMDDEPAISGLSGHQALPEMSTPYDMFWKQLDYFLTSYLSYFVTSAIIGGLTLGFTLHYFLNILPAKKSIKEQKDKKKEEEEMEEEIALEEAEIVMGDSVFRGTMNSKMIAALRKPINYSKKSDRGLLEAMQDIVVERQQLLGETEDSGEDTMEEDLDEEEEESQEESDRDKEFVHSAIESLTEDAKADATEEHDEQRQVDDHDVLGKLGTLHGKLATAQLRARTKRMQMEMSQEEQKTEAEMRAKQLESIMSLMMKNQEKFGMSSDDVKEQLNLYNF